MNKKLLESVLDGYVDPVSSIVQKFTTVLWLLFVVIYLLALSPLIIAEYQWKKFDRKKRGES